MAITLQDYKAGTAGGGPPPSVTFNTSASIGDVLVCEVLSLASGVPGATVSDSINSGNYTLLNSQSDVNSGTWIGIYFKIANAAGTPTVSCSETSNTFGVMYLSRFNGFVGTPTADASLTGVFHGTGTAVSCSPITTNFNNELLLTGQASQGETYTSASISGWTAADAASFGSPFYYAVEASSGTTDNFAGTLAASASWQNVFAGIYDAPTSGVSVAWWK